MIRKYEEIAQGDNYDIEIEYMHHTFPNSKFCICIPIDELDDVISKEKKIYLKHTYLEYDIWIGINKYKTVYYTVECEKMSKRNIIYKLISQGVEGKEYYHYLEDITRTHQDNNTNFELHFGC